MYENNISCMVLQNIFSEPVVEMWYVIFTVNILRYYKFYIFFNL